MRRAAGPSLLIAALAGVGCLLAWPDPAAVAPATAVQPPKAPTTRVSLNTDGRSIRHTLARSGVKPSEAAAAAAALSETLDVENPGDRTLALELATAADGPRLVALGVESAAWRVRLTREGEVFHAAAVARGAASPAAPAPRLVVADGPMERVLYADAPAPVAAQAVALLRRSGHADALRLGRQVRLTYEDGREPRLTSAEFIDGAIRTSFRRGAGCAGFLADDGAEAAPAVPAGPIRPVKAERVSSRFGMRLHPLLGFHRFHRGVDYAAAAGTPVVAIAQARVVEAGWKGGYGRIVRLAHPDGMETLYGHLSRWPEGLKVGDQVAPRQVVGFVGASGLATGPHLHFEVTRGGRSVDPERVVATLLPRPAEAAGVRCIL